MSAGFHPSGQEEVVPKVVSKVQLMAITNKKRFLETMRLNVWLFN